MLALIHRSQLLAGVVMKGRGAKEWRVRWGHEGDDSFGLRCRKDGLQVIMTRGSQLYHTATLDEDTLAGCSFGGKSQRTTVLQAFSSIDRDAGDNVVGQAYLSLPYTRPQARGLSSAPRMHSRPRRTASRSIVNRTTALRSIWMVPSLILAVLGCGPVFPKTRGR